MFSFIDFNFVVKKNRIYSSDPYLLFIRKLHEAFDKSCLASRVAADANKPAAYEWPANLGLLKLTHKSTFQLFTKNIGSLKRNANALFSEAEKYNNLLLCWPHPISYLIAWKFKSTKKIVFLVRQNQTEITKAKYYGIKKVFAMAGLGFLEYKLSQLKDYVQIITVGEEMNKLFKAAGFDSEIIVDSLISSSVRGNFKTVPDSAPKLLYVGRLEMEKGVDILLNACVFLKDKGINFQLKIIGTGIQDLVLHELSNKLNLEKYVEFVGHVTHGESLYTYYQESDLLVIPSRTEGFPKTIHEARAFGLPLVATPVGGMYAELEHGVNAWFSKSLDPKNFGNAILELLREGERYGVLSKNLLEEFEKSSMEFAIAKYFKKITG